MRWRCLVLLLLSCCAAAPAGAAERDVLPEYVPSASDFGGVGLMQTRTARMAPDGQLDFGYSRVMPYERYLLTLQALPWLEATFRYTSVTNRDFAGNENLGFGTAFKDRGADLKFLLVNEGRFVPAISLGLQDGLGTGVFSGEYIVASKRFFDFDFSFGIGWGYNGGNGGFKNPLTHLSDEFRVRGGGPSQGGSLNLSSFFSGPEVGFFGGVEYATPLKGLWLKLEYDPNDYLSEPLSNRLEAETPGINVAAVYRPFSWLDLSLGWERGTTMMFRGSLRSNLHEAGIPKIMDPPPPVARVRGTPGASLAGAAPPGNAQVAIPDWREPASVEAAVSVLDGHGIAVEGIEYVNRRLVLSSDQAVTTDVQWQVASRVFASDMSVPTAISFVGAGAAAGRVWGEIRRPAAAPEDQASDIYRLAAVAGIEIESVEMRGDRVTLTYSSTGQDVPPPTLRRQMAAVMDVAEKDVALVPARPAPARDVARSTFWPLEGASSGASIAAGYRSPEERAIAQAMFNDLRTEGFSAQAVELTSTSVTVYVTPRRYRQAARNIGRAAIVAANHAPDSVEEITVALMSGGLETGRVTILRKDLERAAQNTGSAEEVWNRAAIQGPQSGLFLPDGAIANSGLYPRFSYSLRPIFRQHIGGGDQFLLYQFALGASASVQLTRNWSIDAGLSADAYNNFDRITTNPDGNLPRVRSDIKRYLQEAEPVTVQRLQINYVNTLAPDLYGRLSTGIFEEMYGGYGAEFLYRPFGARLAVGFDVNHVYQRDFAGRFEFRDYAITTGHLNLYYNFPFYNLLGQMHVGRYLAGDEGATFQLSRLFDNGVRAGAFFTLTDVPFEDFGEGSFDKGFFIAIPLEVFSTTSMRNTGVFSFRPLTKDGGQRLGIGPRLYDLTEEGSIDSISRHWDQFLR